MTLYLSEAFGWQTEFTDKVAISQTLGRLGENVCPKAYLITTAFRRCQHNLVKALGYIPVINWIVAGVAFSQIQNGGTRTQPNHEQWWTARCVAMALTGPLLLIVDLIKFIYDWTIASKYCKEHPKAMEKFNTEHTHSIPPWPGHPVDCVN